MNNPHPEVTKKIMACVLDHWIARGIHTDDDGRQSWIYFAFVSGLENMVRVVVSIDDETVVSAFQDSGAALNWTRGNRAYFNRYKNLEVRENESTSDL